MIVDSRPNYFDVPEYDESTNGMLIDPPEVGGHRYDSNTDLITEHEVVPDFVERISPRYVVNYNDENEIHNSNNNTKKYFIPGSNKSKLIKMINLLMSHLPLALLNGKINDVNSIVYPIKAGDTTIKLEFNNSDIKLLKAYLSSNNLDITNIFTKSTSGEYTIYQSTPTIPFKYDDEVVVFFE